jgi:hypothetical protein
MDHAQWGLALGETIRREREAGEVANYREAGQRHGISKTYAGQLVGLQRLSSEIQASIQQGNALGVSIQQLIRLSRLPNDMEQRQGFDELLSKRGVRKKSSPVFHSGPAAQPGPQHLNSVRGVLYFNPQMFVDQRRRAGQTLSFLYTTIGELNQRLASPHSRRGEASVLGEVMQLLGRKQLADAFAVQLHRRRKDNRSHFEVEIILRKDEWRRRRRFDGFSLLIGHPDLLHTAEQLVELFRAKDAVEKDFQTIKSVLKLRPVRHRTDAKVRAHVTLCMLALLLERTLEHRLADAGLRYTAEAAFEILSTCHLNQEAALGGHMPLYTVTRATTEQLAILHALDAQSLVDDKELATTITPR